MGVTRMGMGETPLGESGSGGRAAIGVHAFPSPSLPSSLRWQPPSLRAEGLQAAAAAAATPARCQASRKDRACWFAGPAIAFANIVAMWLLKGTWPAAAALAACQKDASRGSVVGGRFGCPSSAASRGRHAGGSRRGGATFAAARLPRNAASNWADTDATTHAALEHGPLEHRPLEHGPLAPARAAAPMAGVGGSMAAI